MKKKIVITRTARWTYETVWPDHYDNDESLDEAKYIETKETPENFLETLSYNEDADFDVDIEVKDHND